MGQKKPVIAIMYDFDKTLCTKDMQEYDFISSINSVPKEFWKQASSLAKEKEMDKILAYMYLMIRKSKDNHKPIKREVFVKKGKNIEFFNGVEEWFDRITEYGKEKGVTIEHYIISSGLKEIIEGSKIYKKFKKVYACEFLYDENELAIWPKMAVNYTTKTQFLFRINKGVLDISEDEKLNQYVDNEDRPIPFRNMIYIGDGLTDVPCMKLVKSNGGKSIAVYQPRKKDVVAKFLNDKRVDFIALADYSDGKEIDKIVKDVIVKMSIESKLVKLHRTQIHIIRQKRVKP
ncbi:MAG: HAD family hydrolase [Acidaminococcaceae bacterium]|nr:HAD family hydrolase [Acidaminococcaceae bacterium]